MVDLVCFRFGVLSLGETGAVLGLCLSRVEQIEKQALRKLRRILNRPRTGPLSKPIELPQLSLGLTGT